MTDFCVQVTRAALDGYTVGDLLLVTDITQRVGQYQRPEADWYLVFDAPHGGSNVARRALEDCAYRPDGTVIAWRRWSADVAAIQAEYQTDPWQRPDRYPRDGTGSVWAQRLQGMDSVPWSVLERHLTDKAA